MSLLSVLYCPAPYSPRTLQRKAVNVDSLLLIRSFLEFKGRRGSREKHMLSTTRYRIAQVTRIALLTLCCLAPVAAQESADSSARDPLEEFNRSLQQVVAKVSPAIVQIEAVGYNRKGDDEKSDNRLLAK